MRDIQIEGGEVLANLDDRTITGLLLPYGEQGRTNIGRLTVMAGDIAIPADPEVAGLNVDHDRFKPVGRAARLWETAAGIMASLKIARTPEGDQALLDARPVEQGGTGKRMCLSAEFTTGIKDGRSTGGILAGAALVARGAFPSAQVLAADTDDEDETDAADDTVTSSSHSEEVYTDENGKTYRRVYDAETTETPTEDGREITTTTTITEEETDAAAEVETEQEQEVSATATPVPVTQRPTAPAGRTEARGPDAQAVLAAMGSVLDATRLREAPSAEALAVLAALSDITTSTLNGGGVLRPDWLGQLYQGVPYVRQYVDLGTVGTNISVAGKAGYTLGRGTSGAPLNRFDGTWAGDKTDIKSGVGFTKSASSQLARYAFGDDIARELFDLPGGREIVESFMKLVLEDHLIWSDLIALDTWCLASGLPVAPKTYPTQYTAGLGQALQGILAVKKKKADGRTDEPTFVIANEMAFEQLIYTAKDLIPEFVNFNMSTDRTGAADGIRLVVGDTGVQTNPSLIVGSSRAVEFDELAGGPLRIDALDIAKGGIDQAVHGYFQRMIVRPSAVVHIGVSDNWAATTVYREGQTVKVGAAVLQATKVNTIFGGAGLSGAAAPTAPAVGGTVTDGAGATQITWTRLV